MEVDKEIIRRCKECDKDAFIQLYKIHEKYLYSLCYSYVQNSHDALDLVQEIYIKLFKNIEKFDEDMPFHPWIRRISVNTCLNFQRTKKHRVISINQSINDEDFTIGDTLISEKNVLDDIINLETKGLIKENLKELPTDYRLAIILRYYENLSYIEIATLMDKPLGSIKTYIYRAKKLLRKKLENR